MTILAPTKEFEAEAREVAYGLMVKGYTHNSVMLSMVEDVKWDRVLELGSLLARVNYIKVAEESVLSDTIKLLVLLHFLLIPMKRMKRCRLQLMPIN